MSEATQKAENFCVYQERYHQEVKNKLIFLKMIPEAINVDIVYLIENNFINQTSFATSFARGKHRIKAGLLSELFENSKCVEFRIIISNKDLNK